MGLLSLIVIVDVPPGAIAFVPFSLLNSTVKAIAINGTAPSQDSISDGIYPLRMTVFILSQNAPEGAYADFIDWIQSEDGQKRIRQSYSPLPG